MDALSFLPVGIYWKYRSCVLFLPGRSDPVAFGMFPQDLMEKLKVPSNAELMKIAINDLNNLSLSLEDRHRALQELLILVEPIDNANGTSSSQPSQKSCLFLTSMVLAT